MKYSKLSHTDSKQKKWHGKYTK